MVLIFLSDKVLLDVKCENESFYEWYRLKITNQHVLRLFLGDARF